MHPIVAQAIQRGAQAIHTRSENALSATAGLPSMNPNYRFALRLVAALAAPAFVSPGYAQSRPDVRAAAPVDKSADKSVDSSADTPADPPADPRAVDKKQALDEFIAAYRLAQAWQQMAPKIARDSLPRLEDATHADIDADALADKTRADAAHARVAALLPRGRQALEAALRAFDADEFAAYTAYSIYAKYFETAEIREISAFFDSDTGRKLTALAATILAESRRADTPDPMERHFDATELAQITAFWRSPVGMKMNATALQIRDDMHAHFIDRSQASVQAVARELASQAEADAALAPGLPASVDDKVAR